MTMEDDLAPARGIVLACIGGLAFWTTVALVMLWGATAGNAVWVLLHGAASADGGVYLFMAMGAMVGWRVCR